MMPTAFPSRRLFSRVSLTALILCSGVASAHHGTGGQFDQTKSLEVFGTVTKIRLVNPHSYVYFDSTNEKGEIEKWRCEMRAGSALKRSGWSKDMFAAGTKIKIIGVPAFREPTGCYVNKIEFDDGNVVQRYQQLAEDTDNTKINRPARLATGEPNISGDWAAVQRLPTEAEVRAIALGPYAPGNAPPGLGRVEVTMSEAGIAASAGYVREDNPRFHCKPTNIIFDWTFDQHINRIEQAADKIIIRYGFMDTVRTIYMDQDSHPDNIVPDWDGYSIGKWDEDTLVVDTIGFSEGILDPRNGARNSEQLRIVERFTVDTEKMTLTREYEGEDPLYLAARFSGQDQVLASNLPLDSYNCEDLTEEVVEGF